MMQSPLRRSIEIICALITAAVVVMAAAPSWIAARSPAGASPTACRLRNTDGTVRVLVPPSRQHWFGTDELGCDLFARTVHGARISVGIAIVGVLVATLAGTIIGAVSGFTGGRTDTVLTGSMNVFAGIPWVVLAVLVLSATAAERSVGLVAFTLGAIAVPSAARIIRGAVIDQRERDYVEAAIACGARPIRVLRRHIGPNIRSVVVTFATVSVGPAIAAETTLAFLGLSVRPPQAGWGVLVAEGRNHLDDAPHVLAIPAAFVVIVALAVAVLTDRRPGRR
jgi:oligopeptide transport system permease protein